jgi:hypothetical protein
MPSLKHISDLNKAKVIAFEGSYFGIHSNDAVDHSVFRKRRNYRRRRRTLFANKTQVCIQPVSKTELITAGYQNRPKPNKAGRLTTYDHRKETDRCSAAT